LTLFVEEFPQHLSSDTACYPTHSSIRSPGREGEPYLGAIIHLLPRLTSTPPGFFITLPSPTQNPPPASTMPRETDSPESTIVWTDEEKRYLRRLLSHDFLAASSEIRRALTTRRM